jgi:DNA-binding response OmpR family regulator
MIAILTESAREASLLATLCDQRSWPCQTCCTLSGFSKLAEKISPRVVVIRQRLGDGYSDDAFAWLKSTGRLPRTRIMVLVPADCSIRQEARQVALGADCVLRDPLRLDVFLEYLTKYRAKKDPTATVQPLQDGYKFAGIQVHPHEHHLVHAGKTVQVAPQVMALLRLLYDATDQVLPYPVLYSELFNQKFTGDTANCRVLLAKAAASFSHLKIDLRAHIKVIPKSGYLYTGKPVAPRQRKRS